ncbi:RNA methyltransferase [Spirillospora sp. NPDC047418]
MAHLVPVPDPADPRLTDYVRLRDVNLRKSLEAEHGLFVAEGEKVIRRAIAAGHPVRSLLMARRWAEPLADVLSGLDAPVYVVDDATMESITGFQVHRGALASLERLPPPPLGTVLTGARRIVICEDIVDHTNIGAIFRCAAALGVDAAVLAPRCADPLYRRSIKVSMGAVFALPYARMTDWHNDLGAIREAGFQLLALTPSADAEPIDEVKTADRRALLLGSEGDGLSSRWLHEADHRVRIPMNETALTRGVDSLNVVAAAAIACYALTRT